MVGEVEESICAPGFHEALLCYSQGSQGLPKVDINGLVISSDFYMGRGIE